MLSEIKNQYAQSLQRSESFLNTKKTAAKSTSINSTRELCLLRNQAECPICATKFVGKITILNIFTRDPWWFG